MRMVLIVLLGLLASLLLLHPARAQESTPPDGTQPSDKKTVCTITDDGVIFPFERYGREVWVTIVPRAREIPADICDDDLEAFWQWGNTTDDVYLFSYGNADNVRLILQFVQQMDGSPEARLYILADAQGVIGRRSFRNPEDYVFETNAEGQRDLHVKATGGYPYIIMRPTSGQGWLVDERANYNYSMTIDGNYPPGLREFEWQSTDGVLDWELQVGGKQPGVADWQTLYLLNDPFPGRGYTRFSGGYRMPPTRRFPDAPPYKAARPIMPTFPFLELGLDRLDEGSPMQRGGDIDYFRENPMPLYFNIRDEQFQLNGAQGFQNGGVYYYNSTAHFPGISFESPFAFYSMDETSRYPHLLIRGSPFPEYSPPRLSFRYSWKTSTSKEAEWQYSLDLAGSGFSYDQPEQIGNYSFLGVHYDELPEWIVSKRWPMATFVEALSGYGSSEGIYAYTAQASHNWPWLYEGHNERPDHFDVPYLEAGDMITLTAKSEIGLPEQFRGEYSLAYFHPPRLTFSPIDNRLHLWYAEGGVWNVEPGWILRMHNLSGGPDIEGWTLEQVPHQEPTRAELEDPPWWPRALPGSEKESLYALDGYLIYSGPEGSELRRADYAPSLFTLSPPTDKPSWQAFRDRMKDFAGKGRDPTNLQSWLAAFPGDVLLASAGPIRDIRLTSDGFRFVVDLKAGHQLQPEISRQRRLPTGEYALTYDGRFSIEPLTPPAPAVVLRGATLTQLQPGALYVTLGNNGLEDVQGATLELMALSPDEQPGLIVTSTVHLLAGELLTSTLEWTPPWEGQWKVTPLLRMPHSETDSPPLEFAAVDILVQPAPPADTVATIAVTTSSLSLVWVVLSLGLFAAFAAAVVWRK